MYINAVNKYFHLQRKMEDIRGSEIGRAFLEARRRREEAQKQREMSDGEMQIDEMQEIVSEPVVLPPALSIKPAEDMDNGPSPVDQAIDYISTEIQDPIEFQIYELENHITRFDEATDYNFGMKEELNAILERLKDIQGLLSQFTKKTLEVFKETGNASSANAIINRTFKPEDKKEEVRDLLDILKNYAEDGVKIDLNNTISRNISDILREIFEYAGLHFGYDTTEVQIEMDTTEDEQVAQDLADEILKMSLQERFEPLGREGFGGVSGSRLGGTAFRPPSLRTVAPTGPIVPSASRRGPERGEKLAQAKQIVRENPEIDADTMREILTQSGYNTAVIRESMQVRETSPFEILSHLSYVELKNIAEMYGLEGFNKMQREELSRYISGSIPLDILRDIVRENFITSRSNFDLPIIYAD